MVDPHSGHTTSARAALREEWDGNVGERGIVPTPESMDKEAKAETKEQMAEARALAPDACRRVRAAVLDGPASMCLVGLGLDWGEGTRAATPTAALTLTDA